MDDLLIAGPDDQRSVETLVTVLAAWRKSFAAREVVVAPSTLARAWTRFIFAAGNIEEQLEYLKSRYLGVLMHRYIVCFLNAVLVEEATSNGRGADLDLTNPITRSNPLLNNLSVMKDILPPFFSTLFSCPLWAYFLSPRSDDVFARQKKEWEALIPTSDPDETKAGSSGKNEMSPQAELIRAGFSPGRNERSTKADLFFDNLFDPLNSVYIQRNPEQGKPKALKLKKSIPAAPQ